MALSDSLADTLAAFGVARDAMLGRGGEAEVYALGADRVLRVHHAGATAGAVERRVALLAELRSSAARVPFEIPEVIGTDSVAERFVTIERRLPGRGMDSVLAEEPLDREGLIAAYLDASTHVGDLVAHAESWGELCHGRPIRTDAFRGYLEAAAARSLAAAGREFAAVDAAGLAAAWPESDTRSLVHFDIFPGNVLVDDGRVTAVFDFGPLAIAGDRRLDPLAAAVYLEPTFSPAARPRDLAVARDWLQSESRIDLFDPARRWMAAFWSGAEGRLRDWARGVLLAGPQG